MDSSDQELKEAPVPQQDVTHIRNSKILFVGLSALVLLGIAGIFTATPQEKLKLTEVTTPLITRKDFFKNPDKSLSSKTNHL